MTARATSGRTVEAELTNAEKIRRLPWQVASGAANSVFAMLTLFGSVFMLFLNDLGLPKTQIGILLSLFPFCGLLALVVAPAVERAGYKRTYLIFWTIRKLVAAGLIASPWVLVRFGGDAAFFYVAGIVLVFAVCRAIGETAWYPWSQEIVPDSIRGKFGATSGVICTGATIAAVAAAGFIIERGQGLGRYQVVMAIGVLFGFASVWAAFFIPGGAAVHRASDASRHASKLLTALRDRNFVKFLAGVGLVTLAVGPLYQFFFLFMKEEMGLAEGRVVWLAIAYYVGVIATSYLWGWASDRFGSKPVMVSSVSVMAGLPVLFCCLIPGSAYTKGFAAATVWLWGVGSAGWGLSMYRYFYVSVVPVERRTQYTAIFYAWVGLTGGCGPLLAGRALDAMAGFRGSWWVFSYSQYTPFFLVGAGVILAGVVMLSLLKAEGEMPARHFVAMFFQGNPLRAARSSMRWYFAKDESERISTTETLGATRSPLNVEELLDALRDPSFNVRYEALISIARGRADDRLVDALIGILEGEEPEMSMMAAWALSRAGATRALPALRRSVTSEYPALRSQSARALARLADHEVDDQLLQWFRAEKEEGVRVAFASALGSLMVTEAAPDLLAYLAAAESESIRRELVLALSRVVGQERAFIRLWRDTRAEMGTAVALALSGLRKKMRRAPGSLEEADGVLGEAEGAFAKGDVATGCRSLAEGIALLPNDVFGPPVSLILSDCATRLGTVAAHRHEYVLLTIAALHAGVNAARERGQGRGGAGERKVSG